MIKFLLAPILLGGVFFVSAQSKVTSAESQKVLSIPNLKAASTQLKTGKMVEVFNKDGKRVWPNNKSHDYYNGIKNEKFDPNFIDPIQQKNYPSFSSNQRATTSILRNIVGVQNNTDPLDPSICVGPNHIIELTNNVPSTSIKIWNKNGTVALNETTLQAIVGIPGFGDPIALYDQYRDRFILTEFFINGRGTTGYGFFVMVSKTNDPTGAWDFYRFDYGNSLFLDYPKFAVAEDGLYCHTNNFIPGSSFDSSSFMVINKDDMYNSADSARNFRLTQQIQNDFTTCPAQVQGTGFANRGCLFVARSLSDTENILIKCSVDWAAGTFTERLEATIPVANSSVGFCRDSRGRDGCLAQPDGAASLETLTNRIMNQPIIRQFSGYQGMVYCQTVNVGGGRAGIRWAEIRNSGSGWKLFQEGTWAPGVHNAFMPTIVYDALGNICLAYNSVSSTRNPGMYYTARKACDPLNTMTLPETVIQAGITPANSSSRWGDYNHFVADTNGQTVWVVGMYGLNFNVHGTIIAEIGLADCGGGSEPCLNAFEPNQTAAAATSISSGATNTAAIATTGDEDFYRIVTTGTGNITVNLNGPSGVDFDMQVLRGGTVLGSGTSSVATEVISLTGQPAGTYIIRVFGFNNATSSSCYTLRATATGTGGGTSCASSVDNAANDNPSTAPFVGINSSTNGLISSGSDVDYYKFNVTRGGVAAITLSNLPADYDLAISREGSPEFGTSRNSGTTNETLRFNFGTGVYVLKVSGFNNASNATSCYNLRISAETAAGPSVDSSSPSSSSETNIEDVTLFPNPVQDQLSISKLGTISKNATYTIFSSDGKLLQSKSIVNDPEKIDVSELSKGIYLIKVSNNDVESSNIFIKD